MVITKRIFCLRAGGPVSFTFSFSTTILNCM
ncbi:hypothetical protein [Vibrio phage vB_pir03]|nr:hypothetical protein [Vibrio phage vB_pir03]